MRPSNPTIINALAATSSQTSTLIDASFIISASFQVISSSGSNSGSLQVQYSDDPISVVNLNGGAPVNWKNLGTAATVTSGGIADVQLPQSTYAGYRWLQAVWTPSSGAGTITVNAFTIGVN